MSSLKIRYALYGVVASASLITVVAQASPTDGVFGDYFRRMITTACTGTGVVTGFDDTIGSAGYGIKTCTALSTILGNYQIHPVGGNVGIGTSTPNAKLEVIGSVKIKDGSQGPGKVLTSDEDGFASWKMPSGGVGNTLSLPCVPTGNGIYNICHGSNALQNNTTGQSNAALGNMALKNNTTGYVNVAVGPQSLLSNITGYANTAIGFGALNNSNGNENIAIGLASFRNMFFGDYNIAIGSSAGENLIRGTNNIAIGYGTKFVDENGSNQINIGNIIFGMGLVGTVDTPAGNVGIGVKYPSVKLDIDGAVRLANVSFDCNSSYKGVIRYNTYTDTFEGCNGKNWMAFNSNVALYTWQLGSYGACSVSCGGEGTHTAPVNCKNDSGMNVVDSYCAGKRPDAVTRTCNNGPCKNCITPYPSCSGAGWCTLTNNPSKENEAWVMGGSSCGFKCNADREGSNCEKKKITETYSWSIGDYGDCSKGCGGGTKTRTVVCKDSSGNTMSDETKCSSTTIKPITSESCNTKACEGNSCSKPIPTCADARTCTLTNNPNSANQPWELNGKYCGYTCESNYSGTNCATYTTTITYSWSQVADGVCKGDGGLSCGPGTQAYSVNCKDSNGLTVPVENCKNLNKPSTSESCTLRACNSCAGGTIATWGKCSVKYPFANHGKQINIPTTTLGYTGNNWDLCMDGTFVDIPNKVCTFVDYCRGVGDSYVPIGASKKCSAHWVDTTVGNTMYFFYKKGADNFFATATCSSAPNEDNPYGVATVSDTQFTSMCAD